MNNATCILHHNSMLHYAQCMHNKTNALNAYGGIIFNGKSQPIV